MAKVFVVGPETLTFPTATALADTLDANAGRFWGIRDFLSYELGVLAANGELQALGCASDSSLTNLFGAGLGSVVPSGITPVTTFTTAQAISGFGDTLIIGMAGGISPSSTLESAIAALKSQATSSGVLWRDGASAVPTPQLLLPRAGIQVTRHGSNVSLPALGWIGGYLSSPTIEFSFDGSAFAALPSGAVVTNKNFTFVHSGNIAVGAHTLQIRDSLFPSIIASCTVTVS
jgi:hypothetical protein